MKRARAADGKFLPDEGVDQGPRKWRWSRTYSSWASMRQRCASKHPRYGGRGITVCERWRLSFPNFLADMGERPPNMTLDRIDNDGNYEPWNCRWATDKEQARDVSARLRGRPRARSLTAKGAQP